MMKKVIAMLTVMFTVFAQAICFSQTLEKKQSLVSSSMLPAAQQWDFGNVKEGEIVVHDFTIKNDTPKVLNIKDVNSSCGCTVSEAKKKVLAPGESTTLQVKFNSAGYNGWAQQYIYVHTDNIAYPVLRIIVRANVVVAKSSTKK
jgi:uncharacterized cupredoxin-like copper-binding protein